MAPSLVTPLPVRPSLVPREVRRRVRRRVLRAVLARRRAGLDITTLDRIPEQVAFPLRRTGLDPVPEVAATRAHGPVRRLASVLGRDPGSTSAEAGSAASAPPRRRASSSSTWSVDAGSTPGRG